MEKLQVTVGFEKGALMSTSVTWLDDGLRTIMDTNVFKRHLKAYLFTESFAQFCLRSWTNCRAALYKSLNCIVLHCKSVSELF